MNLTEKDLQTLKAVNALKNFVSILERRKVDIFSGGAVTKETLDEANGRVKELTDLIFLIKANVDLEPPPTKEFE